MRTTKEIFSENLRNLLYAKNKTQAQLAKYTNATTATVSYWVNGLAMPRAGMIDKICVFLNCSVEDLTTDHSKPVQYAPTDIIAEEIQANPRLMKLMLYAMKLSDEQMDKLIKYAGDLK